MSELEERDIEEWRTSLDKPTGCSDCGDETRGKALLDGDGAWVPLCYACFYERVRG